MAKRAPSKPKPTKTKDKVENAFFSDSFSNIGGIGGGGNFSWPAGNDTTQLSQVQTIYKNNRWYLISNQRQVLSEVYVEHGLIQTIIDVPVDDGLRGGVEIKTKQLDPEEIEKLNVEMEREADLQKVGQAAKWNRLFGGAGIVIITDQDPSTPLDVNAITEDTPLDFRAVDMWELFWDKQNAEGYDAEIQEEKYEFYNYYATKIHKSRVMKLKGLEAPSFIRPRLRGWGFSVVESLIRSINQYLKTQDLTFEVIDEFKVDVYKIKNYANMLLSANGLNAVTKRVAFANHQKNFQHALTMDSEDSFEQKELSFAGLAETMKEIRMQVASDLRMPLTKIFGISAAGFSSGEDDIENYNAMVESQVRQKLKFEILKVVEIRCQKMFGFVPDDLSIDFEPLRMLSAEQEENVKTQKFNRLLQAAQSGYISQLEFKDACNKEALLEIQVDTTLDTVSDLPQNQEQSGSGANQEDTRKIAPLAAKSKLNPKEAKS